MRRLPLVVLVPLSVLFVACEPSEPGESRWLLNERSGATVEDSVGDSDGLSSKVTLGQPGHEGTSYRFNGVDSVIRVPSSAKLNPGDGEFTFGAWVNFTELPPPGNWDIVRKGVDGSSGGYYKLEVFNGNGGARARCFFRDGSGVRTSVVRGTGLSNGQWHQLACTRKSDRVTITVDGSSNSTAATIGSIANSSELTIGAKPSGGDNYSGLIDDVHYSSK
jgi:Concanavalin A-like lectin/glucanases superfamily